jgi:hypothetical protein
MASNISSKTPAGLFEFCDYMVDKGYATAGAMEPWKTAAKKILSAVDPEGYEQMDLSTADLDDIQSRFETLTLSDYKHESQITYGKRLRNAVTAYLSFVETGRPPQLRKPRQASSPKAEKKNNVRSIGTPKAAPGTPTDPALVKFPFPMTDGTLAELNLPTRISKQDAERLATFVRTLAIEPQRQIPAETGEAEAA